MDNLEIHSPVSIIVEDSPAFHPLVRGVAVDASLIRPLQKSRSGG